MSAPARLIAALADRYRIERELGVGGMATVYVAEDLKHHRQVAIKVMRPELAASLGAERFLREVEIAAKLSHPHILPVHDSGEADGYLYYVMPLVEGETLTERLTRERQLPAPEALRLAREVAEALAYAHARGIVHRDIKPANILISTGHAMVADFGIARAMSSDGQALTQTGLAIGTPQYMSPEQATGAIDIDGRTDIYALGCVLYEMLSGEPPFTGPTVQAILARSLTENPRPLDQTRTTLPAAVNSTVMRALAKTAADRYSTGAEMVTALSDAEDMVRKPSGEVTVVSSRRGMRPWHLALAAVVLLAVGVIGSKVLGSGSAVAANSDKSVAVLPFENQGTADEAYFADGIVDELRDKLARIGQLTVTASASANQYRATTKTGPQIASELRVGHVLMGKVRWADGADGKRHPRVVTELVDGKTGNVTWRDTFAPDTTDIFEMQGRIATRVASALGAVLGKGTAEDLASRPTKNDEAYDLFLKGQAVRIIGTGGSRARAAYYEQAVALDSNFAQAWGRLAMNLTQLYADGTRDSTVGRRAKEALDRLMRLASDSAVAHLVAANYYNNVVHDAAAARRETERALALDPKNDGALATAATYDLEDQNYPAMFDKLTRARKTNPRSSTVLTNLIQAQIFVGQDAEAIATANDLLALDDLRNYNQLQWAVFAHLSTGDLQGAKKVASDLLTRLPANELVPFFAGYQEMAYVLGDKERDLLYRMTPAAYDNDRAWWGQSLATAAYQQGDLKRARAFADSSLITSKQQVDASPNDPQLRVLYGVMLAYLGRGADANRELDHAMTDLPQAARGTDPYVRLQGIRIHLALGENDKAMDGIEDLLKRKSFVTRNYLKVDPLFAPLKGNARFGRIVAGGIDVPRG